MGELTYVIKYHANDYKSTGKISICEIDANPDQTTIGNFLKLAFSNMKDLPTKADFKNLTLPFTECTLSQRNGGELDWTLA